MTKTPDHMSGINALPKWDPNNLSAGYRYDPTNYDRADYAKFKEARATRDKAANKTSQKNLKDAQARFKTEFSKAVKGKVGGELKKGPARDQINKAAKAGHVLEADQPSSAFSSVTWRATSADGQEGIVTGTFWRGGSLVYSGEMSLDDFLDGFGSTDSLGGEYNDTKPF
jgi:hypothetical protein